MLKEHRRAVFDICAILCPDLLNNATIETIKEIPYHEGHFVGSSSTLHCLAGRVASIPGKRPLFFCRSQIFAYKLPDQILPFMSWTLEKHKPITIPYLVSNYLKGNYPL